jgi:hypothetical protein
MDNFKIVMVFEVRWITNTKKNQQAAYKSQAYPETGYIFNYRRASQDDLCYACAFCNSVYYQRSKDGVPCPTIPSIRINGNHFYNEIDGNFYVEVETLEHYARHQARNCSTQLPLLNLNGDNNNANDKSILIMN